MKLLDDNSKIIEYVNSLPDYELINTFDRKRKQKTGYINIQCGFDIETSSTYTDKGDKFAFMYLWTFGIDKSDYIVYGRTWDSFCFLLNCLHERYNLSENQRLIVYVHNLGFEFQFMRKYLTWVSVFSTDERKPIKALTELGIEFRDSYILSGLGLAKVAENLTSHKIKKLVGDLDYKLVRHSKTHVSDTELSYCNNDVEILLDYIAEQIEQYGNITKIPLTNTGRVRAYVRNKCLHSSTNHKKDSKGKRQRYLELMSICTLSLKDYVLNKKAFMGGFTHASLKYSGVLLSDVHSIDFTSSYPTVLITEKYPMGKGKEVTKTVRDILGDVEHCYILTVHITNLISKFPYESYLSDSKCENVKGGMINNGRIYKADELDTTITNIDLEIILACYNCEIEISYCLEYYKTYLPKAIIESVLDLYEKKTVLKGVEGKEQEYLLSKGMLNSIYGMMVTDIVRNDIQYNESWTVQKVTVEDMEKQIADYNESKQRFLYYTWGIFCTAYARRNLWLGNGENTACITQFEDDYIYSDTDSIKFINYEKHKHEIDNYNEIIIKKLKVMCDFEKIDFERCKPKNKRGVEKILGVWDYEGKYDRFKTLGAKRYLVEKGGDLYMTVAGLSKQNGVKYLKEKYKTNDNVFKHFDDDLYIPSNKTGKNTHTYIDSEMSYKVVDYTGIPLEVNSKSSVHLSECDFTLNLADIYIKFLSHIRKGEIYKGRYINEN